MHPGAKYMKDLWFGYRERVQKKNQEQNLYSLFSHQSDTSNNPN